MYTVTSNLKLKLQTLTKLGEHWEEVSRDFPCLEVIVELVLIFIWKLLLKAPDLSVVNSNKLWRQRLKVDTPNYARTF